MPELEVPAPPPVPTTPPPAEFGVFYRREDAPGFFLRMLIASVDGVCLLALAIALGLVMAAILPPGHGTLIGAGIVLTCWAYEVPLKRSRPGTAGYLLFRVKVVDLYGHRPGLIRMTLRTLVSFGFNPLLDLIWATSDDSRQGLRDKLCGTYVVRRSAVPCGRGELAYASVFVAGMSMIYREVRRGSSARAGAAGAARA